LAAGFDGAAAPVPVGVDFGDFDGVLDPPGAGGDCGGADPLGGGALFVGDAGADDGGADDDGGGEGGAPTLARGGNCSTFWCASAAFMKAAQIFAGSVPP
jgi:hypothetical protein